MMITGVSNCDNFLTDLLHREVLGVSMVYFNILLTY